MIYSPYNGNIMKSSFLKNLKDFLKGMFVYPLSEPLFSERRSMELLFMLSIYGSHIGIPFLFNYYHLRLIPYTVRALKPWKIRVLKERDFFDMVED